MNNVKNAKKYGTDKSNSKVFNHVGAIRHKAINYPSLKALCTDIGMPYHIMYSRLKSGLSITKARRIPIRHYVKHQL